ncbi:hypothetical protein ACHAXT_011188 [Thalassiosira profunda]
MEKTGVHIPRINVNFDPITILKIRKSLPNVIPGAIIRVGADFETHRLGRAGLWRVRGCIEDKLFGGRFTLRERRSEGERSVLMEYSKSWLFAGSGGMGTRLNLSGAYDIATGRGSARFGLRTESTNAIGSYQLMPGRKGFSVVPVVPLERDGSVLIEAKTNVEIPDAPEFVIGTDFAGTSVDGTSVGMGVGGDVTVDVEEVNLIFLL